MTREQPSGHLVHSLTGILYHEMGSSTVLFRHMFSSINTWHPPCYTWLWTGGLRVVSQNNNRNLTNMSSFPGRHPRNSPDGEERQKNRPSRLTQNTQHSWKITWLQAKWRNLVGKGVLMFIFVPHIPLGRLSFTLFPLKVKILAAQDIPQRNYKLY